MEKQDCIGTAYMPLGGGYSYAALRVGLVIRNPQGREIYCQPDESPRLQWQDWLTPWTDYALDGDESEAVATFAQCFCFGE